MRVEARFVCKEIVGPLRSGVYEIPEGSEVSDLLAAGQAECRAKSRKNVKDMLIFLKNGKPAQLYTKLAEGDKVHILLKVFGG